MCSFHQISFIHKCLGYVKGTPWPTPKKVHHYNAYKPTTIKGVMFCRFSISYKTCAVHIKCLKCSGYVKGTPTPCIACSYAIYCKRCMSCGCPVPSQIEEM